MKYIPPMVVLISTLGNCENKQDADHIVLGLWQNIS
jgi:hypothetical protein